MNQVWSLCLCLCLAYQATLVASVISPEWMTRFSGFGLDYITGVSVDLQGNVLTAGYSASATVFVGSRSGSNTNTTLLNDNATNPTNMAIFSKHNSDGVLLWAVKMDGPAEDKGNDVSFDASGNVYAIGTACSDFLNIYDANGTVATTLTLNGAAPTCLGFFVKYSPNGDFIWAIRGDGSNIDNFLGIVRDTSNYLYIVAQSLSNPFQLFAPNGAAVQNITTLGGYFSVILKYNTDGNLVYTTKIDGSIHDLLRGISIDESNNLIVFGSSQSASLTFNNANGTTTTATISSTNHCGILIKLSSSGNFLWIARVDGSVHEYFYAAAADSDGNVYASFTGNSLAITSTDFFGSDMTWSRSASSYGGGVIKYTPNGNFSWAVRYESTQNALIYSLSTDSSRNLYVIGHGTSNLVYYDTRGVNTMNFTGTNSFAFLHKYSPSGNLITSTRVDSPSAEYVYAGWTDQATNSTYFVGQYAGVVVASSNFGTQNATISTYLGSFDGILVKFVDNGLDPIDGGWSNWSEYDTCAATCPSTDGTQTRTRTCTNPAPMYGGASCLGPSSETIPCTISCHYLPSADANFTLVVDSNSYLNNMNSFWYINSTGQNISGFNIRLSGNTELGRDFIQLFNTTNVQTPSLSLSGHFNDSLVHITGTSLIIQFFTNSAFTTSGWNMTVAKYRDGGWSSWSDYNTCTGTCPSTPGTQTRLRSCDNPVPWNGGAECAGQNSETRACAAICNYLPSNQSRFDISIVSADYVNGMNAFWIFDFMSDSNTNGFLVNTVSGSTEPTFDVIEFFNSSSFGNPFFSVSGHLNGTSFRVNSTKYFAIRFSTNTAVTTSGWNLTVFKVINGGWTEWFGPSMCSGTCFPFSQGTQLLSRNCTNPAPLNGGTECSGQSTRITPCSPVCNSISVDIETTQVVIDPFQSFYFNGLNAQWLLTAARPEVVGFLISMTSNSSLFGNDVIEVFETNTSTVLTNFTNPLGNPVPLPVSIPINILSIVNGGWSAWGEFGDCQGTCNNGPIGLKMRQRTCTNPPAQNGGVICFGDASQLESCSLNCTYPTTSQQMTATVSAQGTKQIQSTETNTNAESNFFSSEVIVYISVSGGLVVIISSVGLVYWGINRRRKHARSRRTSTYDGNTNTMVNLVKSNSYSTSAAPVPGQAILYPSYITANDVQTQFSYGTTMMSTYMPTQMMQTDRRNSMTYGTTVMTPDPSYYSQNANWQQNTYQTTPPNSYPNRS